MWRGGTEKPDSMRKKIIAPPGGKERSSKGRNFASHFSKGEKGAPNVLFPKKRKVSGEEKGRSERERQRGWIGEGGKKNVETFGRHD